MTAGTLSLKAKTLDPVTWSYEVKQVTQTEAIVRITAAIDDQWHIYGMDLPVNNPMTANVNYTPSHQYELIGKTTLSSLKSTDQTTDLHLSYFEHYAVFEQRIKLKHREVTVNESITYTAENDKITLPSRTVELTIPVTK